MSLRLPPTLKKEGAIDQMKEILLKDPPYGAKVSLANISCGSGWCIPDMEPWLEESLSKSSKVKLIHERINIQGFL